MRAIWVPVVAAALTGCGPAKEPRADGAWLRLAAVPGRPAAGYLTLRGGATDATLVAAGTPAADRVELHESMAGHHGGMTMQPLQRVALPAGGEVRFAPGGKHLMLFGVPAGVAASRSVPLTLTFADGRSVTTQAKVIAAGDPPPE